MPWPICPPMRKSKHNSATDMKDVEEIEIELDVAVYIRCKRAAEAEGMSLQEWFRQAVAHYVANIHSRDIM